MTVCSYCEMEAEGSPDKVPIIGKFNQALIKVSVTNMDGEVFDISAFCALHANQVGYLDAVHWVAVNGNKEAKRQLKAYRRRW